MVKHGGFRFTLVSAMVASCGCQQDRPGWFNPQSSAPESTTARDTAREPDASQRSPATLENEVRRYVDSFPEPRSRRQREPGSYGMDRQSVRAPRREEDPELFGSMKSGSLAGARRSHSRAPGSGSGFQKPPTVTGISVRPIRAESTEWVGASVEANASVDQQAVARQQTIQSKIEELEDRVREHPDDLDILIQLRYLYLAEGYYQQARAVPAGLDSERADVLRRTMEAVVAAESTLRGPGHVDSDALRAVENLAAWMQAKADLQIPRVALCTQIHSYGRYEPVPDGFLTSRRLNRALLYCELKNFASERLPDGRHRTHLAHRLQLLTPEGEAVWQDEQEKEVTDYCLNRRSDFFFNRLWELPGGVPPGEYVLKVIVEDKIKSQVAEATHAVTVEPARLASP